MKLFAIVGIAVVVLLVGVMLLGGGGGHGPGRHTGSGSAGGPTPSSSVTADEAPASAAGGHAAPSGGHGNGSVVGGPADAQEAARTVQVTTLDTMAFEPGTISVSAGEAVTFAVTNTGQVAHEFVVGDAAMQQDAADEMAQMDDGLVHDGPNSITLQPGETRQLTWRFGAPGTLEYGCHEPGHYEAGMRGQITIS